MPDPIRIAGSAVDLLSRDAVSTTVVASPALAAETIIAQVSIPSGSDLSNPVRVSGWCALTIGASGSALRLRIRETNVAGAAVADTGALTGGVAAGNLLSQDVEGLDAAGVGVYVLTAQVTAGGAASTVSAVLIEARPL